MSAKTIVRPTISRDWALARIALALGRAGFDADESDAILAWVQANHSTVSRAPCGACGGTGQQEKPLLETSVISSEEEVAGLSERTAFLIQGICLACRGRGFNT